MIEHRNGDNPVSYICDACGCATHSLNNPALTVSILRGKEPEEFLTALCMRCFANGVRWAAIQAYQRGGSTEPGMTVSLET